MVDNWLSGTYKKMLIKYLPKASGKAITWKKQQKIIKTSVKVFNFIIMILKFFFFIYIFQKAYKTVGFEQTAILLLTIIMIILKNKR